MKSFRVAAFLSVPRVCAMAGGTLMPLLAGAQTVTVQPAGQPPISAAPGDRHRDFTRFVASEPLPPVTAPPATGYHPPVPLQRTPISYPETARLNRIEGLVKVLFTVDETGKVIDTAAIGGSGSRWLDAVVRDPSLFQWTFQNATLDGRPVTGTYTQEIEFRLDANDERALDQKRAALPLTTGTPDPPYPDAAKSKAMSGAATVIVTWTGDGLVDHIFLVESSGFGVLDRTAMRFAYAHWRVDRSKTTESSFTKTIIFVPPK